MTGSSVMSVDCEYSFENVRIPKAGLGQAREIMSAHETYTGHGGEEPIPARADLIQALGCVRLLSRAYRDDMGVYQGIEITGVDGVRDGAMLDVLYELAPCLVPGGLVYETPEGEQTTRYVVQDRDLIEQTREWVSVPQAHVDGLADVSVRPRPVQERTRRAATETASLGLG
jgi:hypothetical protein